MSCWRLLCCELASLCWRLCVCICLHSALQWVRQHLQTVALRQLLQRCIEMAWPLMKPCTAGNVAAAEDSDAEAPAAALMVSLAMPLQAVSSRSPHNLQVVRRLLKTVALRQVMGILGAMTFVRFGLEPLVKALRSLFAVQGSWEKSSEFYILREVRQQKRTQEQIIWNSLKLSQQLACLRGLRPPSVV